MDTQFFSPLFGGITNTPPSMVSPQIPGSWLSYTDDGSAFPSVQDYAERRMQVNLSYSGSGPDMFGLVTSILQEPKEQESLTDWNSLSRLVPPVSASAAENESRCSRLIPSGVLANGNLVDRVQSRYEENREESPSVELLKSKLSDLHMMPSWFTPPNPCPPASDEVLKKAVPEGEALKSHDFQQRPRRANRGSCDKKRGSAGSGNPSSSPPRIQNGTPFYGERQETSNARAALGANETEGSRSHSARLEKRRDPALRENNVCSETLARLAAAHESQWFSGSHSVSLTVEQGINIPVGADTELQENNSQSSHSSMDVPFGNTECKIPVYPRKVSSNNLPLNPGLQNRNSSGSSYTRLDSKTLNRAPASYVAYWKHKKINALPKESSTNPPLGQPSSSRRKDGMFQVHTSVSNSLGFFSCTKNGKHPNSVGHSGSHLLATMKEDTGEMATCVSSGGFSQHCSTNESAGCHRFHNKQNSDGEGTWQNESRWRHGWMPCPSSMGSRWAHHDGLRRKQEQNGANLSNFINPSFLPLFPLAPAYKQIPRFPPFNPCTFSSPNNLAFPPPAFPLPEDLPCDHFLHLSPLINDPFCGDVAASYLAFPLQLSHYRPPRHHRGGPAHELHTHLEECCQQWRALEKERKKTEADLARMFPGHRVSSSTSVPFSQLPAKPSRVDRLILDQFREQASVCALLGKMERLGGLSLHANIAATLGCHLEAICATQARRKDERINAVNPRGPGAARSHREKDILALAAAVKELAFFTRKTRTALWCAFQMMLPKSLASLPVCKEDVQRALQELCPAPDTAQAKILIESEDKENRRAN